MVNADRFGYTAKGISFLLNDLFEHFRGYGHVVYISPFEFFVKLFLDLIGQQFTTQFLSPFGSFLAEGRIGSATKTISQ